MLALLLLVFVALAGLLAASAFGGLNMEALPSLPIAAVVVGALILLYLGTSGLVREKGGIARWTIAVVLLLIVAACTRAFAPQAPAAFLDALSVRSANADIAGEAQRAASVRIRRNAQSSFIANGDVNGTAMSFLVDSGAAAVVLRQSSAEMAGINVDGLTFDTPLKTANGTSYLATARLKSLKVGPIELDDVEALIAKPGILDDNLLGQSFLRRLASYEVAGDFMTLRQ